MWTMSFTIMAIHAKQKSASCCLFPQTALGRLQPLVTNRYDQPAVCAS